MAGNSDFNVELRHLVNKLNAPKGQRNSFGNYNYRSAEDIIEAVKPLLFEHGLRMKITDTVELIGQRYYVKSTVVVSGYGESDEASAYARESKDKKGMDSAQITGATSSYARKYALNGMFDIDDTKDADTDEHYKQTNKAKPVTRDRKEEASKGPESFNDTPDALGRAKEQINTWLEEIGYTLNTQKIAFIVSVLEKKTIDTLNDADAVADAIENVKDSPLSRGEQYE